MSIPTRAKLWITAYGILVGVWVGMWAESNAFALGLIGFFVGINFGIVAYWANRD